MGFLQGVSKARLGETNYDNMCRRLFADHKVVYLIIEVEKNLIHRFKVILETTSSSFTTKVKKFAIYAYGTDKLHL